MIPAAIIAAAIVAGLWLTGLRHRENVPANQRCRCCGIGRIEHETICAACFASALVETEETL